MFEVNEFNPPTSETIPETEQWGANWWQVSDGQRRQCSPVKGYAMTGVTVRQVFCPRTCQKTDQKTLWTLLSAAFTGGIRQHTWWEWKRLIHAFVGHFMIMDTWGLINKFNKQFTGSLRLTWPFPGAWIGLPHISIIIDWIKTGLNNGTNPKLTMRSASIGYHFKDQTNTVAFISKQRWLLGW